MRPASGSARASTAWRASRRDSPRWSSTPEHGPGRTGSTARTKPFRAETHYPGRADDDGDGRVDEDWLNGRDDDGDGRIDEDFAAFGKLMYSCWFRDDEPTARGSVAGAHAAPSRRAPGDLPVGGRVVQELRRRSLRDHEHGVSLPRRRCIPPSTPISTPGRETAATTHRDDFIGMWSGARCAPIGRHRMARGIHHRLRLRQRRGRRADAGLLRRHDARPHDASSMSRRE